MLLSVTTVVSTLRHLREIPLEYLRWQVRVLARYPAPTSFPVRIVTPQLMGLFLQAGILPLSGGGCRSRSNAAIERQESPRDADEVAEVEARASVIASSIVHYAVHSAHSLLAKCCPCPCP